MNRYIPGFACLVPRGAQKPRPKSSRQIDREGAGSPRSHCIYQMVNPYLVLTGVSALAMGAVLYVHFDQKWQREVSAATSWCVIKSLTQWALGPS